MYTEGSTADPCEPSATMTTGMGGGMASSSPTVDVPYNIRWYLDGDSLISIPHIVVRATYIPDTVRCTRDNPFHSLSFEEPGYFQHSILMQCYVDVQVGAYVLGSGPPRMTVMNHYMHYWEGSLRTANRTHEEMIDGLIWLNELHFEEGDPISDYPRAETSIYGREVLLFLGPAHTPATEVWQIFSEWDVQQKENGTVIAVHPARDHWRRVKPDDYQTHLAALEMDLPTFTQRVTAAQSARLTEYGGRIAPDTISGRAGDTDLPMLITDANQLSQYYRDTGAYGHPEGPPNTPQPVPSCARGTAVENTSRTQALLRDCSVLLDSKDTLVDTATLNWTKTTAISSWDGVTISGDYERVTSLSLPNKSLDGTTPMALSNLTALTTLNLSNNSLTGSIPQSLAALEELTALKLSGNPLTGCIPPDLHDVATNDLDDLNLPNCETPEPATSCTGSTAVGTDPDQGLIDDCNALLDMRDMLAGTATLNWSKDTAMSSWDGIRLGGTPQRVQYLLLTDQDLDGSIPTLLGNLTELRRLDLDENALTGVIPPQLGSLKKITHLYLFENELSGEMPPELGHMTVLQVLYLEDKDLTGEVPEEIGNLSNLTQLVLADNQLSGPLPESLGDLSNLSHLRLRDNDFNGQIPRSLSALNIQYLGLSGNDFTGCLSTGLDTGGNHDLSRPELAALPTCGPTFGESEYTFTLLATEAAGAAVGSVTAAPYETGDASATPSPPETRTGCSR